MSEDIAIYVYYFDDGYDEEILENLPEGWRHAAVAYLGVNRKIKYSTVDTFYGPPNNKQEMIDHATKYASKMKENKLIEEYLISETFLDY